MRLKAAFNASCSRCKTKFVSRSGRYRRGKTFKCIDIIFHRHAHTLVYPMLSRLITF